MPEQPEAPVTLYAWLAPDAEGVEGIAVAMLGDKPWPLVCVEPVLAETKLAQIVYATGDRRRFRLVRFVEAETVDVVDHRR